MKSDWALTMGADQDISRRSVFLLPFMFGSAGLIASVGYEMQRAGVLHSFYSLDRFVQHHLNAVGSFASIAALLGILAGLVILRVRGRVRLVTAGTIFSVVVLLWCVFGLPL
jgi:hypothetical protein